MRKKKVRVLFLAAFTALLAGVGLALVNPNAYAVSALNDSFENNPNSRWFREWHGTGATANYETDGKTARTGLINGWANASGSGWSAFRRVVTLPSIGQSGCFGSVWMYSPVSGGVRVNLEIIDPDTWDYYSKVTVAVPAGTPYRKFDFARFNHPGKNVYLRISLLNDTRLNGIPGPHLRVDDVTVDCFQDPR